MTTIQREEPFTLGEWVVEPEFHLISQGDRSCTLEPRVLSVLLELVNRPNHVISKEEFLQSIWPDTFVGEDALTRCISILRHALEDDPHHPRFIKTIPKVGYRLLIEPRPLEPAAQMSVDPEPAAQESLLALLTREPVVTPTPLPVIRPKTRGVPALAAMVLLLVIAGSAAFLALHQRAKNQAPSVIATFRATTDAGEESRPALSLDGKLLAFVWAEEHGSHQHIYLKTIGGDSQRRLTNLDDDEYSPVWSPNGRDIAFLSASNNGLALYLASAHANGEVRKIYIPGETTRWEQGALAWSPDGGSFLLADHVGSEPSSSLYRIDAKTFSAHAVTKPPSGWEGDLSPAFSPDGSKIAFLRASESAVADIYWMPAAGGEPQRLTHDGSMINGIVWSSDSRSILFSSNRAGEYALWRVSLNGAEPIRLPVGTENATQPAVSAGSNSLAYVEGSAIFGILRVPSLKSEVLAESESPTVSSTAQDSAPSISPDGGHFAFQSWRSGAQQIWISSSSGREVHPLLAAGGELSGSGSPSWSPLGNQIAFDSRIRGHSHIFVAAVSGGAASELTFSEANDIVPRWSADGKTIYFRSNRGGRWQLWKLPASGGAAQPVTRDDGMAGQESGDGKWLFFSRGGESGIWQMPIGGGEEMRVLEQPAAGYWAYWTVCRDAIYYLDVKHGAPMILVYDLKTKRQTVLSKLKRMPPLYAGLSVAPNRREVLISDKHDAGSQITIAQGPF
jgi:Tol biopolymer transport system component/DNA-binding winged helix-turn-helix (wHTH) protein